MPRAIVNSVRCSLNRGFLQFYRNQPNVIYFSVCVRLIEVSAEQGFQSISFLTSHKQFFAYLSSWPSSNRIIPKLPISGKQASFSIQLSLRKEKRRNLVNTMSKDMVEREGGGRGTTGLPFPNCMVTGSKQRLHRFQKLLLLSITIVLDFPAPKKKN